MLLDFDRCRLLVVGDVMLDEYVDTEVRRISPEAPVPVATVRSRRDVPGGAANVARNLAALGCGVRLLGLRGADAAGETLARILRESGIEDVTAASPWRGTTRKRRIIAQGSQLMRLDEEDASPLDDAEHAALRAALESAADGCSAVILSDYAKGVLLRRKDGSCLARDCLDICTRRRIPVFVDPKGTDWERYVGAHCVTPNTGELSGAAGADCSDRAVLEAVAPQVRAELGIPHLLVTRGGRGMAMFSADAPPLHVKAETRQVIDVSGAGDTVIAVLAACHACGLPMDEAARCANTAAGLAVRKAGTAPVGRNELEQALREDGGSPKIVDLPQLREMAAFWRRRGESVVFTNGCFDILHKGHILLIREAAAQGDRLVVAVNSDASVRRLKGPERPVQDERSRAMLMAALQGVDAVIVFSEDTPQELIGALEPDVLVKGGDYTPETVVGADVVLARGGRVHLARLQEGFSTTGICRKIRS